MTPKYGRVLWGCLAATVVCLAGALPFSAARAGDSPDAIMERTRTTYGALRSYADKGIVLSEFGASEKERHAFTTVFNRAPRHFILDFRKQGGDQFVIWGDPDAFHTWWKETADQSDYPNPSNVDAINLSDVTTVGSATKIPTLLYPKASLVGALSHFADAVLDGSEDIGGQPCYRLVGRTNDVYGATGKEVNFRKLTIWIDKTTMLVRQIREERKSRPGEVDRTTTTYEPQANPSLPDSRFTFKSPDSQ